MPDISLQPRYCFTCGITLIPCQWKKGHDSYTGKPILIDTFRCPKNHWGFYHPIFDDCPLIKPDVAAGGKKEEA